MGIRSSLAEAIGGNGGASSQELGLREMVRQERDTADHLQESLRILELAMEDEGWRRLGFQVDREFTRAGLNNIIRASRAMYLANPLIQRSVNVTTYYTWAQGSSFIAVDDQIQKEVVDPHVVEHGNKAELYGHQAKILTHVDQMVDGNVFIAMFTDQEGNVKCRSLPTPEIMEIIAKPGDRQQIWYYKRVWSDQEFDQVAGTFNQQTHTAYYPDWRYMPVDQPDEIGGFKVMWDAPVIHQRTGGLKNMQFGVPSTFAALDWARAYKKFLEDWHTLVASLAKFAWNYKTKGSKVKATQSKLASTIPNDPDASFIDRNPPPTAGSWAVTPIGDEISPIPKTGANMSAEDAKPSRLMIASAMDLPDTILSNDPQQGAMATAQTLDRPTELYMRNWQTLWGDFNQDIWQHIINSKVKYKQLKGNISTYMDGDKAMWMIEPVNDCSVALNFPPILEDAQGATVNALVTAATLNGKVDAGTIPRQELSRMLMEALGVDDVESVLKELDGQQESLLAKAVESLRESLATAGP